MAYLKQNRLLFFLLTVVLVFSSCTEEDRPFLDNNRVTFKLLHGGAFVAENREENNRLEISTQLPQDYSIFYIHHLEENQVYLQTSSGNYVGIDAATNSLYANVIAKEQATSFLLTPHKQYFKLKTEGGENVCFSDNLVLQVAKDNKATIFNVDNYSTLPDSWFSLLKLNWGRFLFQLGLFVLGIYFFFRRFTDLIQENQFSYKTVLVLGFILLFVIFDTKQWKNKKVIYSDAVGYYGYLPAMFIFNDISFRFINDLHKVEDFDGVFALEQKDFNGKRYSRYSIGTAMMYLPFFCIGHLIATMSDYTTYGYSEPYGMMIALGCWLYVFLALFYLRKILLLYFSDHVTAFTLFSIVLATNLFYYTTVEPAIPHAFNFALVTFYLWNVIQWHRTKQLKRALFIGLLMGLITLIRPVNVLFALVFVFYGVTPFKNIKERLSLFWEKKLHLTLIIMAVFLVCMPQFILWKYIANQWFFYSYEGNNFFFNNPHILDGLFSYRKGWLLYTPIMVFALIGIVVAYKQQKQFFWSLLVFTVLNIYVMYSWWNWYYGGGFSSRPMVDSYGLMAIPLATFFAYLYEKRRPWRRAMAVLVLLTTALNLFQTQQTKTCLHWASMTKEAYWNNFFTLGWPSGIEDMLKDPDDESLIQGLDERNN